MEKARIPIVEDEAIIAMEIEIQLQILGGFSLRYFDHSQSIGNCWNKRMLRSQNSNY